METNVKTSVVFRYDFYIFMPEGGKHCRRPRGH